jgi:hypothetical protein
LIFGPFHTTFRFRWRLSRARSRRFTYFVPDLRLRVLISSRPPVCSVPGSTVNWDIKDRLSSYFATSVVESCKIKTPQSYLSRLNTPLSRFKRPRSSLFGRVSVCQADQFLSLRLESPLPPLPTVSVRLPCMLSLGNLFQFPLLAAPDPLWLWTIPGDDELQW